MPKGTTNTCDTKPLRRNSSNLDSSDMQPQDQTVISSSVMTELPRSGKKSTTHARRRVNPDNLASRLGPELIRELESLLVPGSTEMPSFSARQGIQRKYNIDRRHIYDWYHTKGLRVSSKESALHGGERVNLDVMELRPRSKKKSRHVVDSSGDPTVVTTSKTRKSGGGRQTQNLSSMPSTPVAPGGDRGFSGYETGSHLTGFPLQYFFDSPPHRSPRTNPITPFYLQAPYSEDFQNALPEPPVTHADLAYWQPYYDPRKPYLNWLDPFHFGQPLPQEQREAYYRHLADSLGPACGVQESVGTYRAFMTQQVHTYYERLVPAGAPVYTNSLQAPSRVRVPTPVAMSMPTRVPSGGYRTQVSSSLTSHQLGSSPSFTPSAIPDPPQIDLCEHAVGSSTPSTPPMSTSVSAESAGESTFTWPWDSHNDNSENVLDIAELLKSPLLRSRTSTWVNNTSDSSALPTPDIQDDTTTESTTEFDCVFEDLSQGQTPNSMLISEPSTFSVSLRAAKESQGLEKTVTATASRDKNRLKKNRPRKPTSNPTEVVG